MFPDRAHIYIKILVRRDCDIKKFKRKKWRKRKIRRRGFTDEFKLLYSIGKQWGNSMQ